MHWSVYGSLLATLGAHSVSGSHHHHARPRWIRPESAPEHLKSHNADWMEHVRPGPSLETRTFTTTVYKECQFTHSINATSHITASLIHVPTHRAVVPTSGLSTASVSESPTTLYTSLLHMTPTGSKTTQAVPTVVISNESQPTTAKPTTFHIHMTTTVTISETTHPTVLTTLSASNAPNHTWIATSSRPGLPISSASSATSSPTGSVHQPSTTLLPNLLSSVSHLAPLPILGDAPAGIPSHLPLPDLPPLPVNPTLIPTPSTISQVLDWTAAPLNGIFTTERFGARSKPSGERVLYSGNVGIPWGSNIILVSHEDAHNYKYVAQFKGSKTQPWTITFWNKFGPEGKMDGWYGHSALTFALPAGETRYIAFDENSQGAWGAAPGATGLPVDNWGGYTSTWGEFSFGDEENKGWSGWDVSAIQAQLANQEVQGMRICMVDGKGCSIITPQARKVVDAYTAADRHHDGIGGAAAPGPLRLVVDIDYQE